MALFLGVLSMGRWSRRLALLFLQFANVKGASILDVGCGIGSLSFALSDAFPKISITGLDYSQAFVDYARSRGGNGNLHFERGDAWTIRRGNWARLTVPLPLGSDVFLKSRLAR